MDKYLEEINLLQAELEVLRQKSKDNDIAWNEKNKEIIELESELHRMEKELKAKVKDEFDIVNYKGFRNMKIINNTLWGIGVGVFAYFTYHNISIHSKVIIDAITAIIAGAGTATLGFAIETRHSRKLVKNTSLTGLNYNIKMAKAKIDRLALEIGEAKARKLLIEERSTAIQKDIDLCNSQLLNAQNKREMVITSIIDSLIEQQLLTEEEPIQDNAKCYKIHKIANN